MDYNIDRKKPIPYYYQIQQQIIDAIEKSEWNPDEFIPSERYKDFYSKEILRND